MLKQDGCRLVIRVLRDELAVEHADSLSYQRFLPLFADTFLLGEVELTIESGKAAGKRIIVSAHGKPAFPYVTPDEPRSGEYVSLSVGMSNHDEGRGHLADEAQRSSLNRQPL